MLHHSTSPSIIQRFWNTHQRINLHLAAVVQGNEKLILVNLQVFYWLFQWPKGCGLVGVVGRKIMEDNLLVNENYQGCIRVQKLHQTRISSELYNLLLLSELIIIEEPNAILKLLRN